MPKIQYKEIRFQKKSLDLIELVNQVVDEYSAQGYELTLRQVYYQLVARGYIPPTMNAAIRTWEVLSMTVDLQG